MSDSNPKMADSSQHGDATTDAATDVATDAAADKSANAATTQDADSHAKASNIEKDPADWVTGDEAMTGAQASYLKTLSEEAGEAFDDTLNKADASRRIEALQTKTGRGKPAA